MSVKTSIYKKTIFIFSVLVYLDSEVLRAKCNSHFDWGQRWTSFVGLYSGSHGILTGHTKCITQGVSRHMVENKQYRFVVVVYLKELKQHMVEVGWHIDNVKGLSRVFGCKTLRDFSVYMC